MSITKQQLLEILSNHPVGSSDHKESELNAAAVLIPIIEHQQQFTLLFTERTIHLPTHPGQISFPGGQHSAGDRDLLETALRETQEEIGLTSQQIDVLTQLDVYPTVTGFLIRPFVGLITAPLQLTLDTNEVASCFEVPLSYLLNQDNYYTYKVERNQQQFVVCAFDYQDHHIWGATAAIVNQLSLLLAN